MSRIGQQIKDLRTAKGLSPKALGKKAGVSESFILEIESGRKILNEAHIGRLSKILEINLNEAGSFYNPQEDAPPQVNSTSTQPGKITKVNTPPVPQWEQAFTNIIADIPVYNGSMSKVIGSRKAVVQDKRVEGIALDKALYYSVEAPGYESLRLKAGDLVLIRQLSEISELGIYLIRWQGTVKITMVKPVENKLLLMAAHLGSLSAETVTPKEIDILGRCIKAEILL